MKSIFLSSFLVLVVFASNSFSQNTQIKYIRDLKLQIDSSSYSLSKDTVIFQNSKKLYFRYFKENEICDIKLFTSNYSKS